MSRAARLLVLLQALRGKRRPVTASALAAQLDVSLRTIYRDIASLMAEGAPIEGEAGLGYVLKPGHFLPPLMLDEDEADAVMLGLRFVIRRADDILTKAAARASAKIAAILPPATEDAAAQNGLLAGPGASIEAPHLQRIRLAMRGEKTLHIRYVDKKGRGSARVVWPIAIGFFEAAEVLAAWCETRQDFRHFRLDRIADVTVRSESLPRRRRILLAEWRAAQDFEDMP